MLSIDYTIKKDNDTYVPIEKWKNINSNIFMLTAPNGQGKSTYLNIIATGLYGHKLSEKSCHISKTIKPKLENMNKRVGKDLSFDITIKNTKGSILNLKKSLDSKDVDILENNEILNPDQFEKKYFLIYDIPEDPLGRLSHLTSEVEVEQKRYDDQLKDFSRYLNDTIKDIQSRKNPEEIEKLKKRIMDGHNETEKLSRDLETQREKHDVLYRYHILRSYKFNSEKNQEYQEQYKKLQATEANKENQKKLSSKNNKIQQTAKVQMEAIESDFEDIKNTMEDFFSNKYKAYSIIKNIDISESLKDFSIPVGFVESLDMASKQLTDYCLEDTK
ncbi:hypothetical protein MsAg5_16240 [Methanosarcinaceae archaeon Ag5]|uniref:Uncharacterized protein n=1 Tax=Methanolapillus africanus TaxID=3028297 RepID=A0AAE4SDS9_9EURY|nr:hypothetical protein [Methanosarcinaceae archaeon Ag5]